MPLLPRSAIAPVSGDGDCGLGDNRCGGRIPQRNVALGYHWSWLDVVDFGGHGLAAHGAGRFANLRLDRVGTGFCRNGVAIAVSRSPHRHACRCCILLLRQCALSADLSAGGVWGGGCETYCWGGG